MKQLFFPAVIVLILAGCGTPNPDVERGPDGTIAYCVPISSDEPGARIEVNGETSGVTPMTLKIFGDRDGTFHNFGVNEFIVRAYPRGGGPSRSVLYHTGTISIADEKIPKEIFFNFDAVAKDSVNHL